MSRKPKRSAISRPMKMLRTMVCWTASARSWNTVSMPASRDRAPFQLCTGLPRTRISPLVGLTTPARILISVDLPAPLSPIRPTTSPRSTCRLTPPSGEDVAVGLRDVAEFDQSLGHGWLLPYVLRRRRGAPAAVAGSTVSRLAQTLRGEVGDGLVVVGGDEAGAGVDVHRAEPVDLLLAERLRIGM